MMLSVSEKTRSRLRLPVLLGLVALVLLGLLGYRELVSPRRAWRLASRNPDATIRAKAWTRLQRDKEIRGLDHGGTVLEVFAALDDPDPEIRRFAASTVSEIEVAPPEVILRASKLVNDPSLAVKVQAVKAIGDAVKPGGSGRDEAVAVLSSLLKDPIAEVRRASVASLGQVVAAGGRSADPLRSARADDPALGPVAGLLADVDPAVRVEAAYVLACNDRGGESVAMLADYLRGQNPAEPPSYAADRAFLAMMVLAIHSEEAAAFLAGELSATREGYPERPRDALVWAARQSPEARARIQKLAVGALNPAKPTLRHVAALLLHEIGSNQPALPVLIEALGDPSVAIRVQAVEALADIGGLDPSVVPALELATADADKEVRERASAALEAIEWDEVLSGMGEAAP